MSATKGEEVVWMAKEFVNSGAVPDWPEGDAQKIVMRSLNAMTDPDYAPGKLAVRADTMALAALLTALMMAAAETAGKDGEWPPEFKGATRAELARSLSEFTVSLAMGALIPDEGEDDDDES